MKNYVVSWETEDGIASHHVEALNATHALSKVANAPSHATVQDLIDTMPENTVRVGRDPKDDEIDRLNALLAEKEEKTQTPEDTFNVE